ncbi:MAG: TIGR01212 family radical SAM protein [Thiobacillaceae bacterium]|nr:TIGR01212 family radical SAM protein [Thiobacillaceae bacterium]MCX7672129.1 TIGR01212 family radical SAM protein [Thiobacillaceae bacterium]MDW8324484.1 TIGR01212 family radical SAM protein [Burkholderiales bacterium]
MQLTDVVHTFGQWLLERHGERVHKIALNAGFTCPNRDGTKGVGGCSFCNNASFSPSGRQAVALQAQFASGRAGIARRTRARKYLAYFQAYTNTYAEVEALKRLYDAALAEAGVIGLSVGTRPDCVPQAVLDLLAAYRDQGQEVWLELGLQSAFDETLARVNRGHGLREYIRACRAARRRGIPVCTHLIVGLPGESGWHALKTLEVVLDVGVDGLKLHPLHVVKGTRLANAWRRGEYTPWTQAEYVAVAADLIERTPWAVVYHRITGTAPVRLLLAPEWCAHKWPVVNAIVAELARRGSRQGVTGRTAPAAAQFRQASA